MKSPTAREEDEAVVFELVHSSLRSLGAAYIAILVGALSVLGDATGNKALAHALLRVIVVVSGGFAGTGLGLVTSHHFFHNLKNLTARNGRIRKFTKGQRALFWVSCLCLSGSIAGLVVIFVELFGYLKSIG